MQKDTEERKMDRKHKGYGEGKIVDYPRKLVTIYTQLRTNRGPFKAWLKQIGKEKDSELCDTHKVKDDADHRLHFHLKGIDWKEIIGSWENFDDIKELDKAKVWNILPTALDLKEEEFSTGHFMRGKKKGKKKEEGID